MVTAERTIRETKIVYLEDKIIPFILSFFFYRNIWSVRDYKNASCEKYRHHWCLELPSSTPRICPADDTLTPGPTECGPTRPQKYGTAYPYCDFDRTFLPKPRDLCDPTCEDVPSSTIYVACVSRLPPTLEPNFKFCCPTSMPCHNHTAVDRVGYVFLKLLTKINNIIDDFGVVGLIINARALITCVIREFRYHRITKPLFIYMNGF